MTPFIRTEMRLADVILQDPSIIPVINRFGIKLGLGDKSIATICEETDVDNTFFVAILNTYIHSNYLPVEQFSTAYASEVIAYLRKTNSSYERFLLPNIERHLNSFIERSDPANANLKLLKQFFNLFKAELLQRIEKDNDFTFPHLIELSHNSKAMSVSLDSAYNEEDSIAEKLTDIKRIMVIHLNGAYDENLCFAVLTAICNLEKDIHQHNRIRNKILFPFTQALHNLQ